MSKFDYKRLDDIIEILLLQHQPISLDELSTNLSVSTRTIRSDIERLNEALSEYHSHIKLKRGLGYQLEIDKENKFLNFWSQNDIASPDLSDTASRIQLITQILLTENVYHSVDEFTEKLFVSANTFFNDLKLVRSNLNKYNIKIENKSNIGYKAIGEEHSIRSAIVGLIFQANLSKYLTEFESIEKEVCTNIDLNLFARTFIESLSPIINLESDFYFKNALSLLSLSLSRFKKGFHLTHDVSPSIIFSDKDEKAILIFFDHINKKFQTDLSEYEKKYFKLILSENYPNLINQSFKNNEILHIAEALTDDLLNSIYKSLNVKWALDDTLKHNLVEHLKRLLNLRSISSNRKNPILDTVKRNFPLAYEIAYSELGKLGPKYRIPFNEDDVSYIALYLASAIEVYTTNHSQQFELAIICGTGKTLSNIIEAKIKRVFPNIFKEIKSYSFIEFQNKENIHQKYDLIVSTVPMESNYNNFIFININKLEKEFQKIKNAIEQLQSKSYSIDLFQENLFFIFKDQVSKENIIMTMTERLQALGFVDDKFYDSVLEREKLISTSIDENIALPHPLNNHAHKTAIAVGLAPNGVNWGDDTKIKIVFLFSINENDYSKIEFIYDKLLNLIGNKRKQTQLLTKLDFKTLQEVLK